MADKVTWWEKTRDSLIPKAWRIDVDAYASRKNVLDLTLTSDDDAVDIARKIRSRVFSVEEVTVAFCKRAAIAQQLTNCLTEILFDEAISRAQTLDQERKANPGMSLPPLFGLPVSLKDTYHIIGVDASIGLAYYCNQPSTVNSPLTDILLSLGVILYCKTNVPQTMMTADSHNNIFCRTLNPINRDLTAGGSTGGEGALIAMRGSVVGFGTDAGGSARIPAACNGIYGFKPSANLMPFSGQRIPFLDGWETAIGVSIAAGVLATSSRACAFALETIMKANPANNDPSCLRMPWTKDLESTLTTAEKKPLRIAFISDEGLSTPTPPIRRALRESTEKLKNAGVEIIDTNLPLVPEMVAIIVGMFTLDGGQHMLNILASKPEPLVPSVVNMGSPPPGPSTTMEKYFELNKRRQVVMETYSALWRELDVDAIAMPLAPYTAMPPDSWSSFTYTVLFNLLDYPSMAIPVGAVSGADQVDGISNARYGEEDSKLYQKYTGPNEYADAPIAVQVIGRRQDDQAFLAVVDVIDSILRVE
ncbi:amidase signature domain-containing protein [Amylocarpus encephaloides]|uniref:Amidase signature domain-containing protein n=1 Tax=Amylocarpus encephaloides TaxID=45428 RepID=A0A9P8C594_9HELO|nr:amidase signature domain-containing protein [Amylocarpus encephaloides]